jgi:hypothetical protein
MPHFHVQLFTQARHTAINHHGSQSQLSSKKSQPTIPNIFKRIIFERRGQPKKHNATYRFGDRFGQGFGNEGNLIGLCLRPAVCHHPNSRAHPVNDIGRMLGGFGRYANANLIKNLIMHTLQGDAGQTVVPYALCAPLNLFVWCSFFDCFPVVSFLFERHVFKFVTLFSLTWFH